MTSINKDSFMTHKHTLKNGEVEKYCYLVFEDSEVYKVYNNERSVVLCISDAESKEDIRDKIIMERL